MKLKHDSAIRLSATRLVWSTCALALLAPLALAQPAVAPNTGDSLRSTPTEPSPTEPSPTESAPTESAQARPEGRDVSIDLSPLLDGVEQQCHYNDLLERFWRRLPDPEQALSVLNPKLKVAIGDISVTDEPDFRMYSIPVRGTWRQVPVNQIQFGLGKGNGIHVLLVEFAAAPQQARAVFEPLVTRSKLAMSEDPDNTLDATTDLVIDGGKARLICDLST